MRASRAKRRIKAIKSKNLPLLSVQSFRFTDIPNSNPNYKWTATFNYNLVPGLADGFDVFWGGMTCSNDAICGAVPSTPELVPIPEPTTLVLTGFGLIVLVAIGGHRVRKSCRRRSEFEGLQILEKDTTSVIRCRKT